MKGLALGLIGDWNKMWSTLEESGIDTNIG